MPICELALPLTTIPSIVPSTACFGSTSTRAASKLKSSSNPQSYDPKTKAVNYRFTANRGPVVKVDVEGATIQSDRVTRLVPIFQEGSVDEDLLNEGNRRLRDYFQRLGYFDAKVDHKLQSPTRNQVTILYTVQLGPRRRVEKVSITGNHYFDKATLMDLISVHAADVLDRHGVYSQALVSGDVSALQAVYQNNGFANVKVTPETSTPETVTADILFYPPPRQQDRQPSTGPRRSWSPITSLKVLKRAWAPCALKATSTFPRPRSHLC